MKGSFGMDEATEVEGRDSQEGAVAAGQSIINMRRAVQRGEAVVGALSPTVLVWGATQEEMETRVSVVTEALFQQGLVVRVEQAAASLQWLATIPGNLKYGIRARVLATPASHGPACRITRSGVARRKTPISRDHPS